MGSETEIEDSSDLEDEASTKDETERNRRTGDEGRKETVSLDRRRRKLEYRQVGWRGRGLATEPYKGNTVLTVLNPTSPPSN